MELLRVLVVAVMVAACLGGSMLDKVFKKIYGMEQSIHQDISFLQDSVQDNKQSLESVLEMLNSSSVDKVTKQHEESDYAQLKEDVERVKRAFAEEKELSRARKADPTEGVDRLDEHITHQLNNLTNVVDGIENKFMKVARNLESKLDQVIEGQRAERNDGSEVREMLKAFSEDKENQIMVLANISNALEELSSRTINMGTLMLMGLHLTGEKIDAIKKPERIRLVSQNNMDTNQGRLEVLLAGVWGTVCDDNFDDTDATVVCRELGYSTGKARGEAAFGPGSGPILLDEVTCLGTEEDFFNCKASTSLVTDCTHSEDVGVICSF